MVANHILSVGCEDLNLCRKPRKLSSQQQPAKIIVTHCLGRNRTTDIMPVQVYTALPTELQGNQIRKLSKTGLEPAFARVRSRQHLPLIVSHFKTQP